MASENPKTFLFAVWLNVPDEYGNATVQLLKHPQYLKCGDTMRIKIATCRTDLIPKKIASFDVKIP